MNANVRKTDNQLFEFQKYFLRKFPVNVAFKRPWILYWEISLSWYFILFNLYRLYIACCRNCIIFVTLHSFNVKFIIAYILFNKTQRFTLLMILWSSWSFYWSTSWSFYWSTSWSFYWSTSWYFYWSTSWSFYWSTSWSFYWSNSWSFGQKS